MDKSEEKEKPFKVDDRRRFSAEGELKPEHRGGPEKSSPGDKSASGEKSSDDKTAAPDLGTAASARHAPEPVGGASAPVREAASGAEITFSTFIVGLSTQALLDLGEIPDPATGKLTTDLTGAQQLIDILGMLVEKTRGNLKPDEQNLIEAILFDLRMKYVELARQAPR